jgi:methylamine dehydrogenase heavy chain
MKKWIGFLLFGAALAHAELPAEKTGIVRTLPVPYPPHWILVHDGAFMHMNDGKVVVLDADATTGSAQYKGMINNTFMGSFATSGTRKELYVAETFYSRGHRGERTDVLTIYSQATLAPVGEVVMPGGKRFNGLPEPHALQVVGDDRFLLSFNFNPGTSVWVIDLDKRAIAAEVPTPGCVLMFPTGKRGFSSLCADGAFLSVQLDKSGKPAKEVRGKPPLDVEADPLFEKPASHDGMSWFPTYEGQVLPVDFRGDVAKPGEPWSLLGKEDREAGWRPGGVQFLGTDAAGKVYMLFHGGGESASHQDSGTEAWVFDMKAKKRERRIALKHPAISLALTQDEKPLMVTIGNTETGAFVLDVYDAQNGQWLRSLADFGAETPFVVYPAP